ncbi:hypothetical protein ACFOY4_40795 [Actinomadura syzygii]|uniref:Uncharacterized protein n=1 Tax=Actinomadura syzygii TaxID=1427538 RepID=A0A5D0U989_9ACTN|nr:hypothetical protein [Actinomadura syzygii]TYC14677.1 hypothetical protein FXF65_17785 [Actinomadura syzygii]
MAGGAVLSGAVSVLARRAVRRVLVLAGLAVAGWLLGCAAQSAAAHADELPAVPTRVVAGTPVLGSAMETAPRPVGHVVREVSEKAPVEQREPVTLAPPPSPLEIPAISGAPETPRFAANAHESKAVPAGHLAPAPPLTQRRVAKVVQAAPAVGGHAANQVVRHRPAPMRAPVAPTPPDDHSAIGNSAASGAIAGFPDVLAWTPAPPRVSVPRALSALPPAVRTAADEPTFAPD